MMKVAKVSLVLAVRAPPPAVEALPRMGGQEVVATTGPHAVVLRWRMSVGRPAAALH